MGFFKKIFKGVKKVFKKVGRAVKKGFKKFGKFMNKIGIVGQIAMMFVLPHVGAFLMKGLAGAGQALAAYSGIGSTVVNAAGSVLTHAHKFATAVGNGYRTVTQGIMDFGKTALNKIPGVSIEGAAQNFFTGPDSALSRVKLNAKSILDPWKTTITGNGRTLGDIARSSGKSLEEIAAANQDLIKGVQQKNWGNIVTGETAIINTKAITPLPASSTQQMLGFDPDLEQLQAHSGERVRSAKEYMGFDPNREQMLAQMGEVPDVIGPETGVQNLEGITQDYTKMTVGEVVPTNQESLLGDNFVSKEDGISLGGEGSGAKPKEGFLRDLTKDIHTKYNPFAGSPLSAVSNIRSAVARFSPPDMDEEGYRTEYGGGYAANLGYFTPEEFQANPVQFNQRLLDFESNVGQWGSPSNIYQEKNIWSQYTARAQQHLMR